MVVEWGSVGYGVGEWFFPFRVLWRGVEERVEERVEEGGLGWMQRLMDRFR